MKSLIEAAAEKFGVPSKVLDLLDRNAIGDHLSGLRWKTYRPANVWIWTAKPPIRRRWAGWGSWQILATVGQAIWGAVD